jgi:hypothetical protein
MAPGLPRTHLSSSTLIRLLHDHAGADGAEAKQTFAERLSQWLGWTDAIALSAVLNGSSAPALGGAPVPSTVAAGRFMPARGVLAEFDRVRTDLAHAIHTDRVIAPQPPAPAQARPKASKRPQAVPQPPSPDASATPAAPPDDPADFAPCRRQLTAHQRTMTERIAALRADVRLALTNQSAALGQLAAVDAVMDDALAAREKHVLSLVPALLEKRFDALRRANPAPAAVGGHAEAGQAAQEPASARSPASAPGALVAPSTPSAPSTPPAPPAWRIACGREMQDVLLAELDLRLQPVHGMVEALDQEITRQQQQ